MALNAASHNIPGEKTGPVTGAPPALDDKAKSAVLSASEKEPTGQSAPGREGPEQVGDKATNAAVSSEPGTKPDYVKSRVPGLSDGKNETSSHNKESGRG